MVALPGPSRTSSFIRCFSFEVTRRGCRLGLCVRYEFVADARADGLRHGDRTPVVVVHEHVDEGAGGQQLLVRLAEDAEAPGHARGADAVRAQPADQWVREGA